MRAYNGLGWGTAVVFALFAAVGLYGATVNYNHQREANIEDMARAVYWEALAAGEPTLSARIVAHVIIVRADANRSYWGKGDIHDVVYARTAKANGKVVCQFSFTCEDAKRNVKPGNTPLWQLAKRIAREELDGTFTVPAKFAQAMGYNNPGPSARRNVCFAKLALVFLGKAEEGSRHEFYREPADLNDFAERPLRRDVPECNPKGALARHTTPLSRSG